MYSTVTLAVDFSGYCETISQPVNCNVDGKLWMVGKGLHAYSLVVHASLRLLLSYNILSSFLWYCTAVLYKLILLNY